MSYKVLHIVDTYLPETMNWLKALLDHTMNHCEHHIATRYLITGIQRDYNFAPIFEETKYPVPPYVKLKRSVKDLFWHTEILKYIKTKKIERIHFHFANTAIRLLNLVKQTDLPVYISFYGYDYEYLVHQKSTTLDSYQELAKAGVRFIVEGNFSKGILISYGISPQQISILHLLFDRGRPASPIIYNQPIKLFQAASFTEKKNQLALLEGLESRHAGRISLTLIGEIVDSSYYKELVRVIKAKKEQQITLQNKLPTERYLMEFKKHHFSVNLSQRAANFDTEGGCPVFLKDSLVCGRPIISTSHGDIPELLKHNFNGFLIVHPTPIAVSDCLDQILQLSPKSYHSISRNALESVNANAVNNLSGSELLTIYALS